MLKEGLDVNSLGANTSPSPIKRAFGSSRAGHNNTPKPAQPSTPTVVPPTPSPIAGPSNSKPVPPSPASSSNDLFYDAEDNNTNNTHSSNTPSTDRQTNRRSMYRSPGTASSPDLATLLRKAKERGGVVSSHHQRKERKRESPPPIPAAFDRGARPRSSTSYSSGPAVSPQVTPLSKSKSQGRRAFGESSPGPDWIVPSPRPKENGSKPVKSSVRAKTSAFLGKMLGQSTIRERSKTDATLSSAPPTPLYSTPSLFDAFPPPVPPLPVQHQRAPVGSPIADVFSATQHSSPVTQKPLPAIMGSPAIRDSEDVDERSMVFVDKAPVLPLAESILNKKQPELPTNNTSTVGKRRSMSVGDAELKKAMGNLSTAAPLPLTPEVSHKQEVPQWEDTTLHGILDDFKGQLSQLDPNSDSSLDLRDPSTPARRAAFRSQTDSAFSSSKQDPRPDVKKSATYPVTPTLTLEMPSTLDDEGEKSDPPSPIVPPRISSLQTPVRSSSRPHSIGSPRTTSPRHGTSPLRSRTGGSSGVGHNPRDAARLRIMHRSTASSSEPSLIPSGDDGVLSPGRRSSQQDLTVNDLTLARFPSSSRPFVADENTDMETRGKELASRCWNEDEDFLAKDKIAEWLGGSGLINKVALHHYVEFFDFSGLRLDLAFRRLCAKLYIKGETQQVDRILEEFSRRYWDCNPGGLYGSSNIVHAVAYSLLLLNTDLHIAEISTRMSRNQFVRNTLTTIQIQLQPTPPGQISSSDLTYDDCSSSLRGTGSDGTETLSRSKRSDSIASWNSVSRDAIMASPPPQNHASPPDPQPSNGSTPSIQISTGHEYRPPSRNLVYGRGWESDMEALLKEMYNAIKSQQILQPLNSNLTRPSMSSLSPGNSNIMRNRSLRGPPDRLTTLKRGSIRGLQSILGAQPVSPYSSNSSIDGRVSPSPSFATSTHEALYGSSSSFLTPTLGFASNLSHTIIREAQEDDDRSIHSENSTSTTISISDEELALLGAPWAKEGNLGRKQYWESSGKRAKDKAWLDVFVVIQKGELNMFTFGGENHGGGSGTFGGGNWLANAHSVGTVHLAHSLAHALPPPGYNRHRPYCMVLTLANGGVYFFQAGTEELVNEWVSTCNYWAARTSKEPLAGGVSNMEYGWNRIADPYAHGRSKSDNESIRDNSDSMSVRSGRSGRSSRSKFGWREGAATVRATHSPWVERVSINDWKPPLPPTVASAHDEETQLDALRKHVSSMKKDLERHNEFREPMAALYQPRTANAIKSQSNWEKKSQYLLTEIVKYDSYIDSLQAAMSLRLKKRGEKALERALSGTAPGEDSSPMAKGIWKGPGETIQEEAEPSTPGFDSHLHRRERADGGNDF